jgi:hypothetical protein
MPLDEQTKTGVQAIIDDAMAGAGEQLASQARAAAEEALGRIGPELKGLADQVSELAKRPAGGADAEAVNQAVAAAMAARDKAGEQANADKAAKQAVSDARQTFVSAKGDKLPEAYKAMIPESADEAELQAGLDKAIAQLQADAKAHGWRVDGFGSPASEKPAAKPDVDSMSPTQKIKAGIEAGKNA